MPAKKSRPATHRPMHPRCNFQFADGGRCRMLRDPRQTLCLFHHRELLQLESAQEIGAELLSLGGNFQDPIALNFVLGKLFAHVATGRMHRRQASTLAYIAQLLLQTLDKRRYNLARDYHDYAALIPTLDSLYGASKSSARSSSAASSPSHSCSLSPLDESHESLSASSSTHEPSTSLATEFPLPAAFADEFVRATKNAHQPPEPHARL